MQTALHKLRGPSNRGEFSPDQPRSATPRLSAVDAQPSAAKPLHRLRCPKEPLGTRSTPIDTGQKQAQETAAQ